MELIYIELCDGPSKERDERHNIFYLSTVVFDVMVDGAEDEEKSTMYLLPHHKKKSGHPASSWMYEWTYAMKVCNALINKGRGEQKDA